MVHQLIWFVFAKRVVCLYFGDIISQVRKMARVRESEFAQRMRSLRFRNNFLGGFQIEASMANAKLSFNLELNLNH